jgi:hypothetical protein
MSRHATYDELGMTADLVRNLYEKGGTLPAAAKLAGVSRKTFWSWTKAIGMHLERGRHLDAHYSCLAKWIRANPETHLPISPKRIAALTECSLDAIKSYLKRRRRALATWVKGLPDLREVKGVSMLTTEGYALPLIAIRDYSISIPRLRVRIFGHLKSGKPFTIATSRETLQGYFTSPK